MKKLLFLLVMSLATSLHSQTKSELQSHYEAYYRQMRLQGDINGVIAALTHLNVLSPSQQWLDTLAYVYMNNNQHLQALNTIGIEKNASDSDLSVQIKAVSLKAINQPQRALEQFEILNQRKPSPYLAYELADLKILTGDTDGAATNIEFGLTNSKDDMKYAFFERQQPYEVPLKAAFLHLKGLLVFDQDKNNIEQAIGFMDEALKLEPNFNLASLSKQALEARKDEGAEEGN